jgi:hypothetical protein
MARRAPAGGTISAIDRRTGARKRWDEVKTAQ